MDRRDPSRDTRDVGRRLGASSKPIGTEAAKRQEKIIAAAIDKFHERSYAETSVEDVANAVGILKGSIYYYIDSKEDLLYRILDDVHSEVEEILERALARDDLAPLDRLAQYIRDQVRYNASNIKRISIYYHDLDQLSGTRHAAIRAKRKQVEGDVVQLLREAQRNGDIDAAMDVQLAANCAFGAVIWIYTWFKPGQKTSLVSLADFWSEFILSGLRGVGERVAIPDD